MLDVSTEPDFKRSYIHSKETQHVPDAKTNTEISGVEKRTHIQTNAARDTLVFVQMSKRHMRKKTIQQITMEKLAFLEE